MKEDWIMGGWDHCDKIWGLIEIRHVNYVHGKCFICDGLLRWLSTRDTSDDDGGEHEEKKSLKSVGPSLHFPGFIQFSSVQFSSVAQSCPTLCDPMNGSMPGLPVHHQLPESTQTHIH